MSDVAQVTNYEKCGCERRRFHKEECVREVVGSCGESRICQKCLDTCHNTPFCLSLRMYLGRVVERSQT